MRMGVKKGGGAAAKKNDRNEKWRTTKMEARVKKEEREAEVSE